MRLAVSNLAWGPELQAEALAMLPALGVAGVEVAPTRIADWPDITAPRLAALRHDLAAAGLCTSSLQAIFYNRPKAQLLGDAAGFDAMCEQVRRVADIAAALGAGVAVFGAPGSRRRGDMAPDRATALAVERFRDLGDIVQPAGLVLGIEPVPAHYKGDFLMRAEEVIDMVRAVDHAAIRVHLDTGCVLPGGDSIGTAIGRAAPVMAHMHAAEPDLAGFEAPQAAHAEAAAALHAAGYDGWIAIEMREEPGRALAAVETAVSFVRRTYFP